MFPYAIAALGYVHGTNKIRSVQNNTIYTISFIGCLTCGLISKLAVIEPPKQVFRFGLSGTAFFLFTNICSTYGMGYYIGKSHQISPYTLEH